MPDLSLSLSLEEVYVDAARAKLQAGMPARVAAINEDTTLAALPSPLIAPLSYSVGGVTALPQAPAIVVTNGGSEFGEEGAHSFIIQNRLFVWILDADSDPQMLSRRLMRQARAVIETLWDDDPRESLAGWGNASGPYRIFPVGTKPGEYEPDSGADAWRRWYVVQFVVQAFEGE